MGGEEEWEIWQEVRDIAEIYNNACCAGAGAGAGEGADGGHTINKSLHNIS